MIDFEHMTSPIFSKNSMTVRGSLIEELARFSCFGEETEIEKIGDVTYYTNEFWTSRQRQAHRIHEISYRACFKPQLPEFFIDRLSRPGDIIYDPFMGRGTTPVEAALMGRIPFGNDVNPLSRAFTEPRINTPTLIDVVSRLNEIPWMQFKEIQYEDLLVFYHPVVLAKIEGLRSWLMMREETNQLDQIDRWIRMVAINRLTGHSSGFFSVYTLPPNQAVTVERQHKINLKRNQVPPIRNVAAIIEKKSRILLSQGLVHSENSMFLTNQSYYTPEIPDGVVALTITSPPFLDVVNYEADNWLRCWFLGIDPKSVHLSQLRDIDEWQSFITETLAELARITRQSGFIAFEVGEVRNGSIRLEENVIEASKKLPLTALGVMINKQDFTKTSNCWGVSNNKRGTNSNRIVLFKRN